MLDLGEMNHAMHVHGPLFTAGGAGAGEVAKRRWSPAQPDQA